MGLLDYDVITGHACFGHSFLLDVAVPPVDLAKDMGATLEVRRTFETVGRWALGRHSRTCLLKFW